VRRASVRCTTATLHVAVEEVGEALGLPDDRDTEPCPPPEDEGDDGGCSRCDQTWRNGCVYCGGGQRSRTRQNEPPMTDDDWNDGRIS